MSLTDYAEKNRDIEKRAAVNVTSILPDDEAVLVYDHEMTEDEATLVALG